MAVKVISKLLRQQLKYKLQNVSKGASSALIKPSTSSGNLH